MKRIAAIVLLIVALCPTPTRAEFTIVVPAQHENVEAPDGVAAGGVWENGFRLQGVYDSSVFASLPPSQRMITGFYSRPDGFRGTPNSVTWPLTVKLSTTTATPATLSTEFAANIGADELVVHDGPITLTTANAGPFGGPKEFDIAYEFQTPFYYDPTAGNLLMDWISEGPTGYAGDDRTNDPTTIARWIFNEDRNAPRGTDAGTGTPVFKFIFVPEPSCLALVVCSLLSAFAVGVHRRDTE